MTDPVTAGTLAVTALALAGETIVKGMVGEAVKDTYNKLKALVLRHAPNELPLLEAQPSSESRRGMVIEVLDALPESESIELVEPARQLVQMLESAAARGSVGVDLSRLSAMNARFGTIRVNSGSTGVRATDTKLQGDFTVDSLEVGVEPGKTLR
ncbi:hypothetical protein [Trinickia sp.]|uniref:hypothetical protein n=1 Tax=Trinickia sp. TaxID=2571163 RepID=UPI003F8227AC